MNWIGPVSGSGPVVAFVCSCAIAEGATRRSVGRLGSSIEGGGAGFCAALALSDFEGALGAGSCVGDEGEGEASGERRNLGGTPTCCSGGGAFWARLSDSAFAFALSASIWAVDRHLPSAIQPSSPRIVPATTNSPCGTPDFSAS